MNSHRVLLLVLSLAFVTLVGIHFAFTMDDAYIAFRYSKNLAEGNGIVWNTGEDPVEGYTSFSWMILNAAAIAVRIDPVVFSKLTSIFCALMIVWILTGASRRMDGGLCAILVGAIAINPPFAFLTVQGLETALAALLFLGVAFFTLRIQRIPSAPHLAAWYSCALLAGLTRPDALPFCAGTFFGLLSVLFCRRDFGGVRSFLKMGIPFVVLGAAYFAWRTSYFGHLFPNTYYVKMMTEVRLARDADPIAYSASFYLQVLLPYLVLILILLARRRSRPERIVSTIPILAGYLLFQGYLLTITPIQGYFWRFLLPVYPALLLVAIHWFHDHDPTASVGRLGRPVFAALAVLFAVWNLRFIPATYDEKELGGSRERVLAGRALAGIDATMFISASGALPYYSEWTAVDKLGLNSEEIAHHGLSTQTLEELEPDLIVVKSNAAGKYRRGMLKHVPIHRYMVRQERFLAVAAILQGKGQHLFYFARRDSEMLDEIARRLRSIEGVTYGDLEEIMLEDRIPLYSHSPSAPGGLP